MEFQIAVEPGDFSLVGGMGTQLSISSKTDIKEVREHTAQLGCCGDARGRIQLCSQNNMINSREGET